MLIKQIHSKKLFKYRKLFWKNLHKDLYIPNRWAVGDEIIMVIYPHKQDDHNIFNTYSPFCFLKKGVDYLISIFLLLLARNAYLIFSFVLLNKWYKDKMVSFAFSKFLR